MDLRIDQGDNDSMIEVVRGKNEAMGPEETHLGNSSSMSPAPPAKSFTPIPWYTQFIYA